MEEAWCCARCGVGTTGLILFCKDGRSECWRASANALASVHGAKRHAIGVLKQWSGRRGRSVEDAARSGGEDCGTSIDESKIPKVTAPSSRGRNVRRKGSWNMAALDWSQCPAVESVPGRLGGAWVFRGTRMPVSAVFLNLEAGATVEEITEWFHISKEQIVEVLEFAARSLAAPVPPETASASAHNARSL